MSSTDISFAKAIKRRWVRGRTVPGLDVWGVSDDGYHQEGEKEGGAAKQKEKKDKRNVCLLSWKIAELVSQEYEQGA